MKPLNEKDFQIDKICVFPSNHPTWIYFIELCRNKLLDKKQTEELIEQILKNQELVTKLCHEIIGCMPETLIEKVKKNQELAEKWIEHDKEYCRDKGINQRLRKIKAYYDNYESNQVPLPSLQLDFEEILGEK